MKIFRIPELSIPNPQKPPTTTVPSIDYGFESRTKRIGITVTLSYIRGNVLLSKGLSKIAI